MALFRAIETSRRSDRLFSDDLATRMLPSRYRAVVAASRLAPVHRWIVRYIDTHYAGGPRASAVVRTRLIDDHVRTFGLDRGSCRRTWPSGASPSSTTTPRATPPTATSRRWAATSRRLPSTYQVAVADA